MNIRAKLFEANSSEPLTKHICSFYASQVEQFASAVPFIKAGLTQGKKCIYVLSDRSKQTVVEALQQSGIPVDKYLESNQLEFYTVDDIYLSDGSFSPDQVVQTLKELEEEALENGYDGVFVTGELAWFFKRNIPISRLLDYETRLNYYLSKSNTVALCQYNKKQFSPSNMISVVQGIHT